MTTVRDPRTLLDENFYWNIGQYERILSSVEHDPNYVEVPTRHRIGGFMEQWFGYLPTGEVWALAAPDPPMQGFWIRLKPRLRSDGGLTEEE